MKNDKVLELLTKLDDAMLWNDILWDHVDDKQKENVKHKVISVFLMK